MFFLSLPAPTLADTDQTLFGNAVDKFGPKPGAMTFTLFGGAYFHGRDQYLFSASDKTSEIWDMGIRLGYCLTPYFELEASGSFSPTQVSRGVLYSDQNLFTYFLDGIFQIPWKEKYVPYGVLGIGGATYDWDSPPTRNHHFGINYGLGMKFFIFKNLALRPDFRAMTTFDTTQTSFFGTLNLTYYAQFEQPTPKDQDADGIYDHVDQCPEAPESFNFYKDNDGCPDTPPDADKDGIADNVDQCPEKAENINGFEDADGCPDEMPVVDQDKDGVLDKDDQCPKEPETKNGFRDEDGCPDVEVETFKGTFSGVYFASGKARILKESEPSLEKAISILKKYPELRIRIEGHTDNTGNKAFNRNLSQKRAEAVQRFLIDGGIDADRLSTIGFGEEKPIADNKTAEGRKKNRRIELWVQQEKKDPSP